VSPDQVAAIAVEIERYVVARPGAADSAQGIREWWLPATLRFEPLEFVIAALELLHARGTLHKTWREGVGPLYSAKQSGSAGPVRTTKENE
jgi:hypothetical protein